MAANRTASKSAAAFRTISEVSDELEVPQHVLRFWETKFTQVRPMKRGGGRRYYRPEDIELLRRIRDLLYSDGYTIKGVQKLLREGQVKPPAHEEAVAEQERAGAPPPVNGSLLEADTAPEATAAAQTGGAQTGGAQTRSGQTGSGQTGAGHADAPQASAGSGRAGQTNPAQTNPAQTDAAQADAASGGQGARPRGPQSGRAQGPASRAATAFPNARHTQTPDTRAQPAESHGGTEATTATEAAQPAAQQPAQPAAQPGLSDDQRTAIETALAELRAARTDLKQRTGQ